MPLNPLPDGPGAAGKPYGVLQQSFADFNQASLRMQEAFRRLEEKFEDINLELERKNAALERTIAEKEDVKNHLMNILESLTTGVMVTDLEGKVTTLNRCAGTYLGRSAGSAPGEPLASFLPEIAPFAAAVQDGQGASGKPGLKLRLKDRSIEVFGSPMKAADGKITGSVLILRDITKIERLEEMAKRTEKFAAMGEMAANIAHEIRNPLGSIELFASLVMKDSRKDKDRERLSQILTAVKSMDNKISNLLLFTRKQNPLMRRTDLHGVLREVLAFSEEIIRQEGVELSARVDRGSPFISGDAEMLKQVFLNVILNAVQAMPGGGRLGVETEISPEPDPSVEVRVSDTGIGIPEKDINKIFDPFFSIRKEGAGTGLGLAIVHNIVDIHHGSIEVESGRAGTVFRISFPVLREEGEDKG